MTITPRLRELATRIKGPMTGIVMHPGDGDVKPFPLVAPPMFKTALMPEEQIQDMVEQAGFPHGDIPLIYAEGWLYLVETVGNGTFVPNEQLEADQAELAMHRKANEGKINAVKAPKAACGVPVGRAIIRDLHTDEPTMPCEMVKHECRGRR